MRVDPLPQCFLLLPALAGLILASDSAPESRGQPAATGSDLPVWMWANHNSVTGPALAKAAEPDLKALSTFYEDAAQRYQARRLYPDAIKYYLLQYDACKRVFGESDPRSACALNHIGHLYFLQGQYLQARPFFQRALKIYELKGDSNETAILLNNVGVVGAQLGDFSAAQKAFEKAAEFYDGQHPADPGLGVVLNNFAQLAEGVGNLGEAVAIAGRAISLLERSKPSEDLAMSLTLVGRFRIAQGDLGGAEVALEHSLRCLQQIGDGESVVEAAALRHLAKLYAATHRQREAEPLFKRAIQIDERLLTANDPGLIAVMKDYAVFLRATKRKHEAKRIEADLRARSEKFLQENPRGQLVDIHSLLREQGH
jgi:tetratricopeptide (TPR) repeat protein